MDKAKPFCISKRQVWEAYKRVKANRGAAGVDEQSIEEFEEDLENNLYKLWNRLSSGSYFPPPVKRWRSPKRDGGTRPLGIPTVADRVAQTVVKRYLEPRVGEAFPSGLLWVPAGEVGALDAVGVARERCWRYDWVLDLDIQGFFRHHSTHDLLMQGGEEAHRHAAGCCLYIERWLKAPVQLADGTLEPRKRGTPQGGVVSPLAGEPLLALCVRPRGCAKHHPHIPFERLCR